MMLHLVGLTIDKHRAHAAAQAGKLLSLIRGVYVDASDDIDKTVMDHAIRIAVYLYPNAFLSGASAALLAPMVDGRLFLTGRRNHRTRIRGLEIIQNKASDYPSVVPVIIGDDMGEFHLTASSPRQRFLEAFRAKSEHASAVDPTLRQQMAERLIAEYGEAAHAADALWTLARTNKWIREAEAAEVYLTKRQPDQAPINQAQLNLIVAWHGEQIGELKHDGTEWRWTRTDQRQPPLIRSTRPGSLPPFIESLLPEGWLAQILNDRDERETLRTGRRYMSNISIVSKSNEISEIPQDVIRGYLSYYQEDGIFTGRYGGPTRRSLEETFQDNLARIFNSANTPRLSGVQIKAPMCLQENGDLVPATSEPFTHILKPAGTNGFDDLPIVEWICLTLARAANFDVPEVAIVPMPDQMAPALLVERFDIRRSGNDPRKLALEDFCSILEQPAARKYDGTLERMARSLRPLSTNPIVDLEILFRRAVFAWIIADGDMHLKNLALLKVAEEGASQFIEVRIAPVYDSVMTRLFPGLDHDRMALKLNGKDDRITPSDFVELARTIEIPMTRATILMSDCARRVADTVPHISVPLQVAPNAERVRDKVRDIVLKRADPFL